ncbi:Hint domain-containing protein [Pararhodobacter zhoushanensis]|uniref:Hint domain-containing protein n=1 Tax=Pararhodobacter zhoushanensis TaxID=2479545 RepID=UPI0013DFC9B3|nr:Hint domain-containing protein [Pararhodobacter zhoushanensis]
MLHNWVGGMLGQGCFVPYSFADRGNVWSEHEAAHRVPTQSWHETGALAEGLIAGTLVATELGWQPVEDLQVGDRVVTFDNGMRPLQSVRVSTLWTAAAAAPTGLWPLHLPAGALGNRTAMLLLADQPVLIESDAGEDLFGDAFTLVPAGALEGYKGVTRTAPAREVTIVTLEFADDEVVYANGTLLVQCRNGHRPTASTPNATLTLGDSSPYRCLTETQGRCLVAAMHTTG